MKRNELLSELHKQDCRLVRHGSRHDIYLNPATGKKQPVSRHSEIDDALAKHIKKHLGLA
jgi:hypothetical protein